MRHGLLGVILGLLAGAFVPLRRRVRPVERVEPAPAPPPPPPAKPEPEPEPAPTPVPGPGTTGTSPLDALRAEVAARRDEFPPDQVAQWEAYLDAFEAQVQDGELAPGLQGMLDDVFEPLRRP